MSFEIDIHRSCRSCLVEKSEMLGIQDIVDIDHPITIADIVMECTSINVCSTN